MLSTVRYSLRKVPVVAWMVLVALAIRLAVIPFVYDEWKIATVGIFCGLPRYVAPPPAPHAQYGTCQVERHIRGPAIATAAAP